MVAPVTIMETEISQASIQVLPPEVVNQIAAGEVVERPAHLVKELVENSIDAEATEISVDFAQGGRYVKVTDNGLGISPADLSKAFLRFATSKIRTSDDIWRLSSFGFRGEALASISSVSKVTILASQQEQGEGCRVVSHFGKLSPLEPVSRSRGCTVIVEELFQNVPARLKFMKSEVAESGQIKHIVKALALANPQIAFRILQDGKLLYYWPSVSQKERIEAILGVKPLFEGTAVRGRIKVRAFFADPHQVSRVSKNMWFYAQNRFIQDRSLQAAVMEAYRNLLMTGEFPYAVCFLDVDPSEIDVNIHPTKSQVKFVNPQDAFRAVQGAIREVLVKAPWLQEEKNAITYVPASTPSLADSSSLLSSAPPPSPMAWQSSTVPSQPTPLIFEDEAFHKTQYREKPEVQFNFDIQNQSSFPVNETKHPSQQESMEITSTENTFSATKMFSESSSQKPLVRHWSLLQVIGQANLTYLVCQNEMGLVLIDQHAAHERVAFERLMNSWQGHKIPIQQFLFPLPIELSEEKMEALRSRSDAFLKLGIEIEELGPSTLGIKAAPALIKNKILIEEIERFASQILEWGDADLMEKAIADICARMACHSVMRAGQSLSVPEMQRLLEEMDEFPLSSFCPHGRPVSVHYSWSELEKDFGRRV